MDDGRRRSITLTPLLSHDRMQSARFRARSSMAEHRPFKPLVESSNLSALTPNSSCGGSFWLRVPIQGMIFESSALTPNSSCGGSFWLRVPIQGMIFESLRAHPNPPGWGDFWLRVPIQGMIFESSALTPNSSCGGSFWLRVPIQGMIFESLRRTLRAPRSSKSSFAGGFFAAPAYQSDFSITLINTSTTSGSK